MIYFDTRYLQKKQRWSPTPSPFTFPTGSLRDPRTCINWSNIPLIRSTSKCHQLFSNFSLLASFSILSRYGVHSMALALSEHVPTYQVQVSFKKVSTLNPNTIFLCKSTSWASPAPSALSPGTTCQVIFYLYALRISKNWTQNELFIAWGFDFGASHTDDLTFLFKYDYSYQVKKCFLKWFFVTFFANV